MKRIHLLTWTRFRVAQLAAAGFIAVLPGVPVHALDVDPSSEQAVEILDLLSAVHELTSYNGDADVRARHLAAWEQLWTEDATFIINNAVVFEGRDNIMNNFFKPAAFFNQSWIALTPSFRTEVILSGNTAEVYLECIFLDETKKVVAERSLNGTVKKVRGKWLFWRMHNDPAAPLFP